MRVVVALALDVFAVGDIWLPAHQSLINKLGYSRYVRRFQPRNRIDTDGEIPEYPVDHRGLFISYACLLSSHRSGHSLSVREVGNTRGKGFRQLELERALTGVVSTGASADSNGATSNRRINLASGLQYVHFTSMVEALRRQADRFQEGTPACFIMLEPTSQVAGADGAASGSLCQECQ